MWMPLEAAFADGRPLLLFFGAFYDHATHVLDAEVFDDPPLAQKLAARFACARVDVEDRPDFAARAEPGFPRIVIVSPEGKLLADRLRPSRADLAGDLVTTTPASRLPDAPTLADWEQLCDFRLGGFGRPPKLPRAPALALLLEHPELPWARPFVERTLNAIVQGGLHDHLEGGFHRASADDAWVVPLFGKRAADQAALIPLLMRARDVLQQPRFAEAARRAVAWVMTTLAAPGGYHDAEDADIGPFDDASVHTWSMDEARAVLDDDEWRVAQPYYDLFGRGELHSDPTRNVLFIASSAERLARELRLSENEIEARLSRARDQLARAKRARSRPPIDPAIRVASSARLAEALLAFPESRAHALATIENLAPARPWLEDWASLGVAALAADRRPLAERCLAELERFRDGDLYYDSPPRPWPGHFGARRLPFLDGAGESGCALVARLLKGLGHHERTHALVTQLPRVGPSSAGLSREWT